MHIFVIHKSCFWVGIQEKQCPFSLFFFLGVFIILCFFFSHFTIGKSKNNSFQPQKLQYQQLFRTHPVLMFFNLDIEMRMIALFLISLWSWLEVIHRVTFFLKEKHCSESDFVGTVWFQGRLEKENKFSVRNIYLPVFACSSLVLTL